MKRFFLTISILGVILFIFNMFLENNPRHKLEDREEKTSEINEEVKKIEKHKKCMTESIEISLLGDRFKNKIIEVDNFLGNYQAFVSYSELNDNFYYGYNDEKVIYGASLIKLVDALYILDNSIDIKQTLKYSSKYYSKYNKGLTKHQIGDNLSLDIILNHALSVSDNGAHKMLIDYIGFTKLKNYGQSLGAKVILTGGDNFGMQTAKDTNIYLKRLYELSLINADALKIKDYMINDFHSYLNVNNINVAHKYGYYQDNFHDIGIIYDEHPYTISVLTKYGYKDYKTKINEISVKINELHNEFWSLKDSYCKSI